MVGPVISFPRRVLERASRLVKVKWLAPFILVLASACAAIQSDEHRSTPGERLNYVIILVDDLGQTQTGAYGSQYYLTPNIDRLAKSGTLFTNAYSSAALCTPTRAALMTGKTPARLHVTNYLPGEPDRDADRLLQPAWTKLLPQKEVTIGQRMKAAGYRTAFFGKWHLEPNEKADDQDPFLPGAKGFDEFLLAYAPKPHLAEPWQTPENDGHSVRLLTDRTIRFLDEIDDEPFFLILSHSTIHDPIMEKAVLIEQFERRFGADLPTSNPTLGAMIKTLDDSTGEILEALQREGLADNTVVIFTSDNGGYEPFASQAPLRAGKGWLYEGGIRIPLIVRWPGRSVPDARSDAIVLTEDLHASIVATASPSFDAKAIDGVDFRSALSGDTGHQSRNSAFWHYPHYHSWTGMKPAGAVRDGDLKLIEWYEDGALELFDLAIDPSETTDISLSRPNEAERLRRKLDAWRQDVDAQMPTAR
jgi:arylsulfatase A